LEIKFLEKNFPWNGFPCKNFPWKKISLLCRITDFPPTPMTNLKIFPPKIFSKFSRNSILVHESQRLQTQKRTLMRFCEKIDDLNIFCRELFEKSAQSAIFFIETFTKNIRLWIETLTFEELTLKINTFIFPAKIDKIPIQFY
jgi:hypothetical protein